MIMNDCHYYLGDYQPSFDCTMYISGLNFYPVPGKYVLPEKEGEVLVYRDRDSGMGRITMKTCGSDVSYHHPLVRVRGADTCVNYGW